MPEPLPAISLVAVPGRRHQTLDIAREMDRRGFGGIYVPSRFGNMAQCTGFRSGQSPPQMRGHDWRRDRLGL